MVKSKKTKAAESSASEQEEFPFNNQYYDLIAGKTLSKRGVWWTALLLVQSKPNTKEDADEAEAAPSDKKLAKKVIIQRWRRFKQGEDSFRWSKSKDFTISSKNQWNQLKTLVDEWVEDNSWN